jgi:hypothetical protein
MIDRFLESKKKAAASNRPGTSSSTSSLTAGGAGSSSNMAGSDVSKQYRFTEEIKAMMRVFGDSSLKTEVAQALEGVAKVALMCSVLGSFSVLFILFRHFSDHILLWCPLTAVFQRYLQALLAKLDPIVRSSPQVCCYSSC